MLSRHDIEQVHVSKADYERLLHNVASMLIGGKSNVRQGEDRRQRLIQDQLVSQIGEYCASVSLTGDAEAYFRQREIRNLNPYIGDGGSDLFGIPNVDVKARGWSGKWDMMIVELLVREQELKDATKYVHCVVPTERPYRAYVVGWAMAKNMQVYHGRVEWKNGINFAEPWLLRPMHELRSELSKITHHDNSTMHH
jgi:hypothetical protein